MNGPVDVSVILPCLNEEQSVGGCVREAADALSAAGLTHEIIVVDNGSDDASARIAGEQGARVIFEERKGYGSACAGGFAASTGRVILFSDADGTYPLADAPAFVKAVDDAGSLVLGSRFRGEILPGAMPRLHRVIGNPGTRLLLRMLFGVRTSDPHTGMRAMSRQTFEVLEPTNRAFEYTIQMVLNARRRGVRIDELPITYRAREGQSKLRALPQGWSLLRFLLLNSPTLLYAVPGLTSFVLGVLGLAALVAGDRDVGPVTFGVNTLVVASLLTVLGVQTLSLGACARAVAGEEAQRDDALLSAILRVFSLERGLLAGGLAAAAGLALLALVGGRWLFSDFAVLARSDHGQAVLGLTLAVGGVQTILASFLVSLVSRR